MASLSGPIFSKEDRERDLSTLSEKERAQIELDRVGSDESITENLLDDDASSSFVVDEVIQLEETPALRQRALRALQDALDLIPEHKKRNYLRSLQEGEAGNHRRADCDPLVFLRSEQYDAWAAAQKLVEYWDIRVKVFGVDRAFLPLNLTGRGAMSPDDIALLKRAELFFLPNDQHGRPVLFYDRAKLYGVRNRKEVLLRKVFYLLSLLCLDEATRTAGHIVLVDSRKARLEFWDRRMGRLTMQIANAVPCAKSRALHDFYGRNTSFASIVLPLVHYFTPEHLRRRWFVYTESSNRELIKALEPCGLQKQDVPASIGGLWRIQEWEKWVDDRQKSDRRALGMAPL